MRVQLHRGLEACDRLWQLALLEEQFAQLVHGNFVDRIEGDSLPELCRGLVVAPRLGRGLPLRAVVGRLRLLCRRGPLLRGQAFCQDRRRDQHNPENCCLER